MCFSEQNIKPDAFYRVHKLLTDEYTPHLKHIKSKTFNPASINTISLHRIMVCFEYKLILPLPTSVDTF